MSTVRPTSIDLRTVDLIGSTASPRMLADVQRCLLCEIGGNGTLVVETRAGERFECDWLESAAAPGIDLKIDDVLLVLMPASRDDRGVVLGRLGRYATPAPVRHVRLEATESLSMSCGSTSIDLRADGKVMIRGEDVLVRAKKTKRIRAGTVSIN